MSCIILVKTKTAEIVLSASPSLETKQNCEPDYTIMIDLVFGTKKNQLKCDIYQNKFEKELFI